MRLYLAVAVLMLAFVAYTEAQDETFEQRMAKLGTQMQENFQTLADKATTTFEEFRTSEYVTNAGNWFSEQLEKAKNTFKELGTQ